MYTSPWPAGRRPGARAATPPSTRRPGRAAAERRAQPRPGRGLSRAAGRMLPEAAGQRRRCQVASSAELRAAPDCPPRASAAPGVRLVARDGRPPRRPPGCTASGPRAESDLVVASVFRQPAPVPGRPGTWPKLPTARPRGRPGRPIPPEGTDLAFCRPRKVLAGPRRRDPAPGRELWPTGWRGWSAHGHLDSGVSHGGLMATAAAWSGRRGLLHKPEGRLAATPVVGRAMVTAGPGLPERDRSPARAVPAGDRTRHWPICLAQRLPVGIRAGAGHRRARLSAAGAAFGAGQRDPRRGAAARDSLLGHLGRAGLRGPPVGATFEPANRPRSRRSGHRTAPSTA